VEGKPLNLGGTGPANRRVPRFALAARGCASILFSALIVHGTACAGEHTGEVQAEYALTLRPYIHCDGFAGGVRGVALDRRPQTAEPWREVGFGNRSGRVSVVDGYRVAYSYPRTFHFANLKAERSDPSRYAEDKRIVTLNLADMAKADGNTALADFSDRGISGQTLGKKGLSGTTLSITQIFSDEDSVIVTIYFMNQVPDMRRFQTHEEFIALRDSFIRGYVECVARKKSIPARQQD
jgi:hypothetical protein